MKWNAILSIDQTFVNKMTAVRTGPVQNVSDKMGTFQLSEKSLAGVPQLLIDMQRLSDDHESADVIFLLDRDEERIYAHKIILQAR